MREQHDFEVKETNSRKGLNYKPIHTFQFIVLKYQHNLHCIYFAHLFTSITLQMQVSVFALHYKCCSRIIAKCGISTMCIDH